MQALPLTTDSREAILIGLSSVVLLILVVGMGTNVLRIASWLRRGCRVCFVWRYCDAPDYACHMYPLRWFDLRYNRAPPSVVGIFVFCEQ